MKNKKALVGIIVLLAVVIMSVILITTIATQKSYGEGSDSTNKGNNTGKSSLYTISINGKNITLPCKLSELTKTGLKIYSEYDYERIINSQNETFTMIYATSEGWKNGVYLKIVTGDNSTKKEENAMVTVITNMVMTSMSGKYDISDNTTKEQFHLKGGVAIGSSKQEVIAAFGDNYIQSGEEAMSLFDTLVWQIVYVEGNNSAMFYFKNGVVTTIEMRNEEK